MSWILCQLLYELSTCCENFPLVYLSPKKTCAFIKGPGTFLWLFCWKHHIVEAASTKWNVIVLPMAQSQGGPSKCPSPPPADAGRWWRERVQKSTTYRKCNKTYATQIEKICNKHMQHIQQKTCNTKYATLQYWQSWIELTIKPFRSMHHSLLVSSRNQSAILDTWNLEHALHHKQHPIKIGVGKMTNSKTSKNIRFASGCTSYEHSNAVKTSRTQERNLHIPRISEGRTRLADFIQMLWRVVQPLQPLPCSCNLNRWQKTNHKLHQLAMTMDT